MSMSKVDLYTHTQPFNGPLSGTTRVGRYQKNHSPIHTHDEEGFEPTTKSALSQRGLLDPIKPAYNQSRPDGRLKLTTSGFNRLWINMPAVLVAVPTVMQKLAASHINFPHYCSPPSGFYGADNRGRHTNNLSGRHPTQTLSAPTSIIPPFYAECRLPKPSQFIPAWDRH